MLIGSEGEDWDGIYVLPHSVPYQCCSASLPLVLMVTAVPSQHCSSGAMAFT